MNRGSGDIYYHMTIIDIISNSGHIPGESIYPMMQILISILRLTSLGSIYLIAIISLIFYFLYVLYLFILGKTLLGTKTGGIFVSVFGIPFIYSFSYYGFWPFLFALMTVPLLLYLYQKIMTSKNYNYYYICVVFLSLFIILCHPTIAISLILSFSLFSILGYLKYRRNPSQIPKNRAINVVLLLSVPFFLWVMENMHLFTNFGSIISSISSVQDVNSIASSQVDIVTSSHVSFWLLLERFVKVYGSITIYFLISSLFLLSLFYVYFNYRNIRKNDLNYALQYCLAIIISIGLIFGDFRIHELIRAMSYGIFFATILCGISIYRIWNSSVFRKHTMGIIISITLITSFTVLSCNFDLYRSPWEGGPSMALSYEDKNGFDWISVYQNPQIPILNQEQSERYYMYHLGILNSSDKIHSTEFVGKIPDSFGYNTYMSIGKAFPEMPYEKIYIIITQIMKQTPYAASEELRDQKKHFDDPALFRLNNDPSADLVYSNNEFQVRVINTRV